MDASNHWGPNPPLIYGLLRKAGFAKVFYQDHPVAGRTRGTYHAFRTAESVGRLVAQQPPSWIDMTDEKVWKDQLLPIYSKSAMELSARLTEADAALADAAHLRQSRSRLIKALLAAFRRKSFS